MSLSSILKGAKEAWKNFGKHLKRQSRRGWTRKSQSPGGRPQPQRHQRVSSGWSRRFTASHDRSSLTPERWPTTVAYVSLLILSKLNSTRCFGLKSCNEAVLMGG